MTQMRSTIDRKINDVYDKLTNVEKNIAEFFLTNQDDFQFSSKNISARLFVSEASLSRFAKKCGYKGFREFIYEYDREFHLEKQKDSFNQVTKQVVDIYQELLDKNLKLVDETQMARIAGMLSGARRIFVYGMGSSGFAAKEFSLRFMRLGLFMEAITDAHIIKINAALATSETLIIGVSLSGTTAEIVDGMRIAREQGASVLLITANGRAKAREICDEVLVVAGMKELDYGIMVSPQFPVLVMVDIFFAYYLNTDFYKKAALHTETVSVLKPGKYSE